MGRQPIVRDPKNYKYYIPYDMVARTGEPGESSAMPRQLYAW